MSTTHLEHQASGSRNYWLLPALGCALAFAVIAIVPGPSVMRAFSFGSTQVCLPGYQLQSLASSEAAPAEAQQMCVATGWGRSPV